MELTFQLLVLFLGVGGTIISILPPTNSVLGIVCAAAFFLAGIFATALMVLTYLNANKPPKFVLSVRGSQISIPDQRPNSTNIVLLVTVTNSGPPGILKNWQLKVLTPGAVSKMAEFIPLGLNDGLKLTGANPGALTVIPGTAALEEKTNKPVVDSVAGWLWFVVGDTRQSAILSPKTVLTLSAEDQHGQTHSITESIDQISRVAELYQK